MVIISTDMVTDKLEKIGVNKSPGPDKIHPRVLKEANNILHILLSIIFNKSLESGRLPKEWKNANITAIYKKGSKLSKNYRPVSLTSIIVKFLESIIRHKIIEHMKTYNLFSNK
jgi:hypothetical protein